MRHTKLLLIMLALTLITIDLWILAKPPGWQPLINIYLSFGQLMGLIGLEISAITLVLSTRLRFIEDFLGGLDQAVNIHRLTGSVGFLFLLQHPLFMALNALPSLPGASIYFLPGTDLGYNLGIAGLGLMILSFVFLLFVKLPYHLWLPSHQFLVLAFILGGVHGFLIQSDVARFPPLKTWFLLLVTAGTSAGIYSIALRQRFGPQASYLVTKIERALDIIHIYLRPTSQRLAFLPGQFCYAKFDNPRIGGEVHPFSISSGPDGPTVRLSVKILGDYTLRLPAICVGDRATLFGPHGRFGRTDPAVRREVWIAGGIGVTPFISLLHQRVGSGRTGPDVYFYYCVPDRPEAVFDGEITSRPLSDLGVQYFLWPSREFGQLTGTIVAKHLELNSIDRVLICGPALMMASLARQFEGLGLAPEKIQFEEFSFLD